nr:uncharacterized protein I203_03064 [Kwoniella mangroviensis CBS 8507]OCF67370.1 hypothetical protein I203_03064 [Kwoniella mangroviensis CBS 8507]
MSPSSPAGSSSSSLSEGYTNVLLALPDGTIPPDHSDLRSHTVSLIGGYPTFPPLPNTAQIPQDIICKVCKRSMPLLAQVYCPLENGENDRTVYVFACSKAGCQKKDGSIRAFRASIRNEEYVKDVEEKRKAAEAEAEKEREKARKNPFTPNGSTLFGSAQPLFGAALSNPFAPTSPPSAPVPPSTDSATADLFKLSISPSPSSSTTLSPPIPAYQPAQYLTTIDEYLPPPDEVEYESSDDDDENADEELKGVMMDDNLERLFSQKVDEVFQRFVKRLEGSDGGLKQVLRYDFGGIPLPYSSQSPITRKLFSGCEKPLGKNQELDVDSLYNIDEKVIKRCEGCGGKRTFELQLTPYLISLLKPDTISTTGQEGDKKNAQEKLTEEERKKELQELAQKIKAGNADGNDEVEMEWGNIMVFGCENDCIGLNEEVVGVEWEMGL